MDLLDPLRDFVGVELGGVDDGQRILDTRGHAVHKLVDVDRWFESVDWRKIRAPRQPASRISRGRFARRCIRRGRCPHDYLHGPCFHLWI
jgi:hypothetical protein